MKGKLIDTHIHVWNFDQADYPWLRGDVSILNRSYELEELEGARRKAGVSSGVLVQAANNLEDTEWMLSVAAANDWIAGVVGWLPLQEPAATARLLEGYGKAGSRLKGVRHLIHNEPDPGWLLQESVLESLGLLAARDIPFDVVGIIPAHIESALKVAEKLPELRMVFDHLNQPPPAVSQQGSVWEQLMKVAAGHANIYAKISGLGTAAGKGKDWTASDLEPGIAFALRYFGPDRCFCGGDWPVSLLAGSYEQTWAAYRSAIEKYTDEEGREKLYFRNAERFYGLPLRGRI